MKNFYYIFAITLFVFSCSSSNPSSPGGDSISEGNWTGTTATGETITFSVLNSQVNDFHLTMIVVFHGLPDSLIDTVSWNLTNINITSNSFSANDSLTGNPSYTFSISGNFNPPNSVSGMLGINGTYHPDSSSTWLMNDSLSWNANFNN